MCETSAALSKSFTSAMHRGHQLQLCTKKAALPFISMGRVQGRIGDPDTFLVDYRISTVYLVIVETKVKIIATSITAWCLSSLQIH